jgi:hypothetical protein
MGSLSDSEKLKIAYFHSLGKVNTEANQAIYESKYKSSHNIRTSEIWVDSVNTASTFAQADFEAGTNPAVFKHTQVTLTPIPGSNNQAYYYDDSGTFVRPWISPVDVPHPLTNDPSNGYTLRLYNGSGGQIGATNGAWAVDYYAGIIHFGVGQTPVDLGWGAIKATFYAYNGSFLGDLTNISGSTLTLSNKHMQANTTSSTNNLATNTALIEDPLPNSEIIVKLNGVGLYIGNASDVDGYFSWDAGVNKRALGDQKIGDKFYWNYSGTNPVAGYHLEDTDYLDFVYLKTS